jgi:hypothetical protein
LIDKVKSKECAVVTGDVERGRARSDRTVEQKCRRVDKDVGSDGIPRANDRA